MKKFLVGNTGFVGSNIGLLYTFDEVFDKDNIEKAYGKSPDILFYAGVTGNKTMANNNIDADQKIIDAAKENIKKINAKKLILISTVDVYEDPYNKNENDEPKAQFPYGKHRAELEKWVQENVNDYHIIRLPAIYGKNLRKNLVFDLVHLVPPFINEDKYNLFSKDSELVKTNYVKNIYGYYELQKVSKEILDGLYVFFESKNFRTVNFTDSRAIFQFFDLNDLKKVIDIVIENNVKLINVVTCPIASKELIEKITGKEFTNHIKDDYQNYDLKTIHCKLFGRNDGYIESKKEQLAKIEKYVMRQKIDE